ncbi:FHA domain-containing protein [Lusitaniella coriacea LEGE 07157]|uniref:FHA domain-containing protein n=1 Tax=Lusitaniella coriacea LEGE 07157 TaxID=945747 RepID=A0A8J7E1F1_9CYAN|nr:FHA domain-containing protein [Lusitaniella coriacea]MBE9117671.1 FHA domain-containing protein [Lusitaniella coriacea LEGE 07157]
MITLTLLHPLQAVPVQSWTFDPKSRIRVGRSTDNEVILYSAVVSRHHIEIQRKDSQWEIRNLGANGTYLDGKRINKAVVIDGMVVRLASSGPQIQIHIKSGEVGEPVTTPSVQQQQHRLENDHSTDTLIT